MWIEGFWHTAELHCWPTCWESTSWCCSR